MKSSSSWNGVQASLQSYCPPPPPLPIIPLIIIITYQTGGGIIDLLNSRLQNRLTESEILKIFSDTVSAVAHMHSQNPILIHRDLKVPQQNHISIASLSIYIPSPKDPEELTSKFTLGRKHPRRLTQPL
jgi:AP2-associated kinase